MTIAMLLLAVAADAAPDARRSGRVEYATQERLYLDAGSRDGLASGQVLQLRRGPKASGSCKVETVTEARATCIGTGRIGDTFELAGTLPPPPQIAVRNLPPPESTDTMARRRAAMSSIAYEKVDFHPQYELATAPRAEVSVSHTSWAATGVGPWHQERADITLHGVPLVAGFTLDADMSARRWSLRSGPVSFRPDDPTQLYVWEAAISRIPVDNGLAMSLGRVRPRFVPGQVILDGAQAGWKTHAGSEVGLFGGAVPDEVTLSPSLQHGTFGAYWAGQHTGEADSVLRLFRHEARVAFVNTEALGKRVEGEALVQLWLTRAFDAAANVRVGSGDHRSPGYLDAVRIDGNLAPVVGLSINGGFRYEGLSIPELDGPATVRYGGAARHADLSAQYEPSPYFRISVISGLATDLAADLTRRWIGPEVGSPQLFGGNAGVALGYLEEQGWAQGRSGYVQLTVGQRSRVQVVARASWYHSHEGLGPEPTDDLIGFASIRAQLSRFVALRLTAMGRTSLNGATSPFGPASAQSGWFDGDITGQF